MTDIRLSADFVLSTKRPLFVTGTDTEVGKTYVSVQLLKQLGARGLNAGAYKPVASGCHVESDGTRRSDDAVALWNAIEQREPLAAVCPQQFIAPLAPPSAAKLEGKTVNADAMCRGARWWLERTELLLIEGAGGLLSPLADEVSNADLALELGAELVIVASDQLGVINHTRLTEQVAQSMGLTIRGIILNRCSPQADASVESNAESIQKYCRAPLVGIVDYQSTLVYSSGSVSRR